MRLGSLEVLRPWLLRQRLPLCAAIAAGAAAQAIGVALPLLVRWFVRDPAPGSAAAGAADASLSAAGSPWTIASVLAALVVTQGFLRWQRAMLGERMAQRVLADARGAMYAHLQLLAQGYYDKRPLGSIVIRFVGDANALRTWIGRTIISAPADVLTILAVAAAVAHIDVRLLAVALTPLALLVPIQLWLNPLARRLTRESRRGQTLLCGFLSERLHAMAAVQAANAQPADRAEATRRIGHIASANIARGRLDAWSQGLSVGASTAALGSVGLLGAWLHQRGELRQGDLLAAVWLLLLIRGSIQRLSRANAIHQRVRVAADRIAALLERKPEPGWSERLARYSGPGRSIAFRRISYRSPSGAWLVRDLTAELTGPGLVAVIGGDARARSALLQLCLRVRRPHRGRIRLDGQDIRRLRVADVRHRMGWLDRERRLAEVVVACSADGIAQHPGFDSAWSSTERLSPGRSGEAWKAVLSSRERLRHAPADVRLRVSMACALLEEPPVLLLDEPQVGLDRVAVARLHEWLREAARTRLIVLATSDPVLATTAGSTLVLESGGGTPPRVIAEGAGVLALPGEVNGSPARP